MEVKVAPKRSESENRVIEVSWNNLTYTVKRHRSFFNRFNGQPNKNEEKYRTILKGVNGSFRSGQLTAVMGPSGAGKSSLLECVCGKRSKGLTGDIKISGTDTIKVAFVEQFDHLLEHLTVKESLVFASRLRNASQKHVNHETIALNLIHKLGLEVCTETKAIGCSGGQRKRLSIALELVSKANILVLDEPTSGLDSSATSQTINAMESLTRQVFF
jgi:ABC-type multidrug transport system ATPase subunit